MTPDELTHARTALEHFRQLVVTGNDLRPGEDARLLDAVDVVKDLLDTYGIDQRAERDRLRAEQRERQLRSGRNEPEQPALMEG